METLIAYKKAINYLPEEVKMMINNLSLRLSRELSKKEQELDSFIRKPEDHCNLNKSESSILYIARHGETDDNRLGLLMGRKDIELNKNGIEQAHTLGKKARKLKIDFIISSPTIRAKQTAEIVKSHIHKPIKFDHRLIERDIGVYEGLTMQEVEEKFQKGFDGEMAYNKTPPGGESAQKVKERVFSLMEDIKRKYPNNKRILIITHSFVSKMINKYFHPQISADEFFNFQLSNTRIKKFKLQA